MGRNRTTKVALAAILTLSLCANTACASYSTSELSSTLPIEYSDANVIVVGDYDFTSVFIEDAEQNILSVTNDKTPSRIELADNIINTQSLSPASLLEKCNAEMFNPVSLQDPYTIVISPNVANNYLVEGPEKTALNALIHNGHVAFFPESTYSKMSEIFKSIAGSNYNATPLSENGASTVTPFVFENNGEFFTGSIIAKSNTLQSSIDRTMLEETYINSYLSPSSVTTQPDDFTLAAEWNPLCAWHKNVYEGSLSGRSWFSEWICFFSAQANDNGHYYAWAGEWCMEPVNISGVQWVSDYVKYESYANSLQSDVLLRDYIPKNTPSSSTGTVTAGIDTDKTLDISFSYDWEIEDLSFNDNSSQVNDYCRLRWDYTHRIFSNYDQEITYGNFAMIFNDPSKSGGYTFHHYRDAYSYAQNMIGENIESANFSTYFDFMP